MRRTEVLERTLPQDMRFAFVALLLLGGSVAGLSWLTERAAENPRERELASAIDRPTELERLVKSGPDSARRMMQNLWASAVGLRARGEQAEGEFEKATRLANAIEKRWQDPCFSGTGNVS